MLDVATLLQLDLFSNFTLCAGAPGLGHNISNVVVLDHEGLWDNFSDFHEGDFVLTNLFYAKDDPERIYTSFSRLMQIGVSAIAIKSIFYKELPENVLALANRKNVPIFFFQDIYIEDVILCITDYIRSSTDYSRYEQLIDTILCAVPEQDAMHELLSGMAAAPFSLVSCLYLSYRKKMDALSIQRYLNKLQIRRNSLVYLPQISFRKYKNGILFFFFVDESGTLPPWETILRDFDVEQNQFDIGIGDCLLPLSKLDTAIRRSIYAADSSASGHIFLHSSLTIENLVFPMRENSYVKEYLSDLKAMIDAHETGGGTQLFDTLTGYVDSGFKIDETAALLYQHPNTIRYRIAKLKNILRLPEDSSFQFVALLLVKCA